MKKLLYIIIFGLNSFALFSNTIIVSNTNDSGIGSLRNVIANSLYDDTISFNPSLLNSGNATIYLTTGEIMFNKNITIIGIINSTDTLFISGSNNSRIFNASGSNVNFDKLAIINGLSSNSGGAIYSAANLTIKNSIIKNNQLIGSSSSRGGAIYSRYSLIIENSIIENNTITASNCSGAGIAGSDILLTNSIVKNNTNKGNISYGAGIQGNNLTLINSSVISNINDTSTLCKGAGIYVSYFNINNSVIKNNQNFAIQSCEGAGIFIYGDSSKIINNSLITENMNHSFGSNFPRSHGAGIYTLKTPVRIDNSIISKNENISIVETYGAGIYSDSTLLIENSTIIENKNTAVNNITTTNRMVHAKGGGIYSSGELTVDNSTISKNINLTNTNPNNYFYSESFGGGVYLDQAEFNISFSTVSENVNDALHGSYGGGILSSHSFCDISQTTIALNTCISNTSSSDGGGGDFTGGSTKIKNVTITGNEVINPTNFRRQGSGILVPDYVEITSSIVAGNIGADNLAGSISYSGGYNIFQELPLGYSSLDQLNVSNSSLSLGPLQFNGGATKTCMPNSTSVAINQGSPSDVTDAQNNLINGIRDVGSTELSNTVTINESLQKNDISIYPNPTINEINIDLTNTKLNKKKEIKILDIKGKLVYSKIINDSNKVKISCSFLEKGAYKVLILSDNSSTVTSFIKS